jgi:hypothetical protein
MVIQAYGRCGGCNYWHNKGLPDEAIREKMAGRLSQEEVRRGAPKDRDPRDEGDRRDLAYQPRHNPPTNAVPKPHALQLCLDMTDHPDILRGVADRARGQFRPVEMQILWELSRNGISAAEE